MAPLNEILDCYAILYNILALEVFIQTSIYRIMLLITVSEIM